MLPFVCSLLLGIASFQGSYVAAQHLEVELCDKFASANSSVLPFSYSNNAWGNETGLAVGYQCTRVYDAGASWTATYKWTGDPTVVKAYPRMRAWPSNMPMQLKSLTQLMVNANFKTFLTNGGDNDQAYSSAGLVANVAMDLFVASTAEQVIQISPPLEVMIWPWWTPTILPLGYDSSTPQQDTVQVNGVSWSLYHGVNAGGQTVYSWLAQSNVTSLNGDYSPLIKYLVDKNYLSGDLWAAQLELGQEMKWAASETNFQVDVSELRLVRNDEGETSAVVQTTTPSPDPVTSSLPSTTVPETTLVTTLVTTTTEASAAAPAPSTTTTPPTTEAPAPAPQTTVPSTSAAPPPTTTTTDPPVATSAPASSAPASTTTNAPSSQAPAPTTTSEAPPPSTTEPSATTTSVIQSSAMATTTRSTLTTTHATTQVASPTQAAPSTTTSNAATSISQGLEDSWFMLLMALIAGFA